MQQGFFVMLRRDLCLRTWQLARSKGAPLWNCRVGYERPEKEQADWTVDRRLTRKGQSIFRFNA